VAVQIAGESSDEAGHQKQWHMATLTHNNTHHFQTMIPMRFIHFTGNLTSSMLANDTDTLFFCVVFGIGFSWIFFVVSGAGSEESLGSLCGIR